MKFLRTETKNPLTNQRVIVIGSLIDWKMRSSRNATLTGSYDPASLIDWKMRSSRNSVTTDLISTLKFNRLENAL